MKIIRPEQPIKQEVNKEEITQTSIINGFEQERFAERKKIIAESKLFIDNKEVKPFEVEKVEMNFIDDKTNPIEYIMNEVIDENTNKITFLITLTKRQYELFNKKGGINWLKKVLVGQKYSPHGRGKKKKK